jgi:hypothetical protein
MTRPRQIRALPRAPALAWTWAACGLSAWALAACDDPAPPALPTVDPVFRVEQLTDGSMGEIMPCKLSHEHELRHVRTVADLASVDVYSRCVPPSSACKEPRFPVGSLFVKLEYNSPTGCEPDALVSYTATLKLPQGALEAGYDWQWQRLSPALKVEEDGAPGVCLRCHIDHCAPPRGFDLRCVPD